MGWSKTDYDILLRAIASGAREVKYEDKEVKYRSLNEMLRTKREIERALGISSRGRNRTVASYRKGA